MRVNLSEPRDHRPVRGRLRRRLLVNAVVDPDEAAARLPGGLRPHVTASGTVVGCCLLQIEDMRPARLPAGAGIAMRAAAHRISAEWTDERGEQVVGVFVPGRWTDSRLAVLLGGRWFPGVHHRAAVEVRASPGRLSWRVDGGAGCGIAVTVSVPPDASEAAGAAGLAADEPVGSTCLAAAVGVSPGHDGRLEGARMEPEHRRAREVVVEDLRSAFVESFRTARPAPTYLVEGPRVTWSATPPPHPATAAQREEVRV